MDKFKVEKSDRTKLDQAAEKHGAMVRDLLKNNCGISVASGPIIGGFRAGFAYAVELLRSDEFGVYQAKDMNPGTHWWSDPAFKNGQMIADWLDNEGKSDGST